MINIDYRIERDEGNVIAIYKPKLLPTKYENIAYIKGPNSSGKSTLLNLIATGFYGKNLSDNELDSSLHKKILGLLDLDHQKLTFIIKIDNPKIGWALSSIKSNPNSTDISVKLKKDGQERFLSSEMFYKEFRLIYDIPYNPLERLPQILQDIKGAQIDISEKMRVFKNGLIALINEIRTSKDPEKIEDLEEEIIKYSQEKHKLEFDVRVIQKFYNKFLEYYLTRFYVEFDRMVRENSNIIKKLEGDLKEAEKEGRKSARNQSRIVIQINRDTNQAIKLYHDCELFLNHMLSNKEKAHLTLWKNADIEKEINYSDVYSTIREETQYFLDNFSKGYEYEIQAYSKDLDTIEVYKKLLSTLSDIRYDDVTLPGVDQTVEKFKQKIIEELEKYEDIQRELKNFEECIDKLKIFLKALDSIIKTVNYYKKMPRTSEVVKGNDLDKISNKLKETKRMKDKYDNLADNYRKQLIKHKFDPNKAAKRFYELSFEDDLKPYEIMHEASIITTENKYKKSLAEKKQQLSRFEEFIASKEEDLILMEEKEPHQYRKHLYDLEVFFSKVQILERKFVQQFSKYINHAINKTRIENEDELHYANFLGNLLASKIDTLKYVDMEHEVKNVDLQSGVITTEEDKKIMFEDLGTGHSQAAFFQAKLAMKDNRKIIALFDEVAMMDENTLEPIKQKLVKLYNNEKLFMAIIVQKSNTVDVESLI